MQANPQRKEEYKNRINKFKRGKKRYGLITISTWGHQWNHWYKTKRAREDAKTRFKKGGWFSKPYQSIKEIER